MTPERHRQIGQLYHSALELNSGQRAAFLEDACRGDLELRREVESLLAAHERSAGFFSNPAAAFVSAAHLDSQLPPGAVVGSYRVLSRIGAGGMGEVYLAEDTRLGRKVALKLMPRELGGGAENERFEHEARAASALNHPNIVTVHDVGVSGEYRYIVMEFVAGQTLREILAQGPTPDCVGRLGSQIARALAVAHEAGIVHRDVKPENVMVREDGYVKLLDFGLASLAQPAGGETHSEAGAALGLLGTAAYMSPEQASGEAPTAASDVFSLGVVFYEIAAGQHPFAAGSLTSTLHAIVARRPDKPSRRNPAVEPWLDELILTMLEKDVENRPAAAEVEAALSNHEGRASSDVAGAAKGRRTWWWLAATAGLLVAGVAILRFVPVASSPRSKSEASAQLTQLTWDIGLTAFPSISPDGKMLAFASDRASPGNVDIWVQPVDGGEPARRTDNPGNDDEPCFSPDGKEIAYHSVRGGRSSIYVMPLRGGEEKLLVENGSAPKFSPDGQWIAYSNGDRQVYVVSAAGGTPKRFQPDFARVTYPIWLTAQLLLFMGGKETGAAPHLDWWVAAIDGGAAAKTGAFDVLSKHQISSFGGFWYAPGAWSEKQHAVLFTANHAQQGSNLWQVALERGTWKVSGAPRQITNLTLGSTGDLQPSMARDGRTVFTNIENHMNVWMAPLDSNSGQASGSMQRLTQHASWEVWHDISPDGNTLVFNREKSPGDWDIWLKDLRSSRETPLVVSPARDFWPKLNKSGRKVAYAAEYGDKREIRIITLGETAAETVCEDCTEPLDWSPDGRYLLYRYGVPRQIGVIDVKNRRKGPLLQAPERLVAPKFSPDGRWLAFSMTTLSQSGEFRLMVAPFRGFEGIPGEEWVALTDGSSRELPVGWSADGRLLYSFSAAHGFRCLFAHRFDPATGRRLGRPFEAIPLHRRYGLFQYAPPGELSSAMSHDKCVFTLGISTGNIWMTQLPEIR